MRQSLCKKCKKDIYVVDVCKLCFRKGFEERLAKELQLYRGQKLFVLNPSEPFLSILKRFVDEDQLVSDAAYSTSVMLATTETCNIQQFRKKILEKDVTNTHFLCFGTEEEVYAYAQLSGFPIKEQIEEKKSDELFLETIYKQQPQTIHALNNSLEQLD